MEAMVMVKGKGWLAVTSWERKGLLLFGFSRRQQKDNMISYCI